MLNIPDAVKQLFKSGESQNYSMSINVGTSKYFTNTLYTIPEENIKGESAELRETLFSGNNPKFGTIQTSQFTVSLLNFNLLLKGKYIRVFLHYGPALNIIPYGEFYVESVEKAPYSSETKLICYDYSYFLNVQAANKIRRIPTATANTAISMCEAIFDKLHLQYTPFTSSTTYNYVTKIPDNTTYGNMLEWMGELYGGWWKPDRYGVFRFVQIGSSASPELIDTFRPKAGDHGTSEISDFTGIIFNSLLRLDETKEQDYLYGSDDGLVYTMDKSNPYIVNYNESQLNALGQTLLTIYNSIKYIPNKIKIDGRPYLECGDWYTYLTDDDTEDQIRITAPVIQSIISGIGALNQTLQAVGGTEYSQSSERTVIRDTQTIVSTESSGYYLSALTLDENDKTITPTYSNGTTTITNTFTFTEDTSGNITSIHNEKLDIDIPVTWVN